MPWERSQYLQNSNVLGVKLQPITRIVSGGIQEPAFTAGAALAEDLDTGEILYQKNINQKMSPASTTKIMTAVVASEYFQPYTVLTVNPGDTVAGSSMDLTVGEQLTFENLLYGMLLNSGNDAAFTIADNYPGGLSAFIIKMNEKADQLGLTNTHFQNPAGFDSPNHYSSASDLSIIAKEAIKDPNLAKIFATKQATVTTTDGTKAHNLFNLNELLSKNGVIGIKTGYTEIAGENFVGLVDRNGHKVLTVILNSTDRFGETKSLMDWVYDNFSWQVTE
jgi:D-alanyl-D-alanine carboxypeptidase